MYEITQSKFIQQDILYFKAHIKHRICDISFFKYSLKKIAIYVLHLHYRIKTII